MRVFAAAIAVALSASASWAQSPPEEPQQPPPQPPAQQQPPPKQPPPAWTKKLFYGGSAAVSFGSVEGVTLAPLIGYHVIPRFSVGAQPFYRYAKYTDYNPDITTHDYGIDVFGRFNVFRGFFLQAQYEWIDYDAVYYNGTTSRQSGSYWYGGAGYSIGAGHVGGYVVALYQFNYDSNDPLRPYDSPWQIQAGVGVGF
jgi:hypothetical protein